MTEARRSVHAVISGRVQGVGFRHWTLIQATSLGLTGWVGNRPDGAVEAVFCGPAATVDRMIEVCRQGPVYATVAEVRTADWEDTDFEEFQITH